MQEFKPKPTLLEAVIHNGGTRLRLNTEHFQIHSVDNQFFIIPVTLEGSDVYNSFLFNAEVKPAEIELDAEPAAV